MKIVCLAVCILLNLSRSSQTILDSRVFLRRASDREGEVPDGGKDLNTDYVISALKQRHRLLFDMEWNVDLQRQAEQIRDKQLMFRRETRGTLSLPEEDYIMYILERKWIMSFSRNPANVRTFADDYVVHKHRAIMELVHFNGDEGEVGCAIYFQGWHGKLFCLYKF